MVAALNGISQLDAILAAVTAEVDHHEHIFPRADGEGAAGDVLDVITDAEDESNGAASTANYWGEPVKFDPSEAATFDLMGLFVDADTAQKLFQLQIFVCNPSVLSAKSAGNAWDEAATVLTVADGSLFATGDLVAIVSDYKTEIQRVSSVLSDEVTVARETSQFGANNTGLRWDHTTNDPGTEVMYRVWRADVTHSMERYFSVASAKDSDDILLHDHRIVEGLGFVLVRTLNQTDNTNGAHFHAGIVYEN